MKRVIGLLLPLALLAVGASGRDADQRGWGHVSFPDVYQMV